MTFLPDGEKTQFLETLETDFAAVASVLSRYTEGSSFFYDLALLQKSIALADTRNFQQKLSLLTDYAAKNTASLLNAKMKALNNDNLTLDARVQLSLEADSLRTLLKNDKTANSLFATDWLTINYKDIQDKLEENEVAIEFLDFKYQTPTLQTNKTMYYALVLRKTELPIIIPLFEEKELIKLLDESRVYETDPETNAKKVADAATVKKRYDANFGKKLYDLIWKPIENAQILRGVQTVHFAPSGLLNRVSFGALPVGNDLEKLLIDRYQLRQYNSTVRSLTSHAIRQRCLKICSLWGISITAIATAIRANALKLRQFNLKKVSTQRRAVRYFWIQ
jgi:CHAT domain-containing protein